MSRSGYSNDGDYDQWSHIRWRGQVTSAIRGKRGQAFLHELIEALDALPEKRLIANELENGGNVCAIGSVGLQRGIDMSEIDVDDYDTIAAKFGIARQLVQEIEWMNDEGQWRATPESRWQYIRNWAASLIAKEKSQ